MKEKTVIVGNGGHAKVVIDILREMGGYEIIGITTDKECSSDSFCGYPILGNDDILSGLIKNGIKNAAIGIGGFRDNSLRKKIYKKIEIAGFRIVSAVHPSAVISRTVSMGQGNIIFPGVIINTDVRIGNNVIIATGSTIDHETVIKDNVLISAGVNVGASTVIEEGALLAIGSKVVSGINIGKDSLVAAGAVIVNDVRQNSRVFGIPARHMGDRGKG